MDSVEVETRRGNGGASSGCIVFPQEGGEYQNTKLGGMYVQLVALETKSKITNWWDDAFLVCFGGSNTSLEYQEQLAGTDTLIDEKATWVEDQDIYDKEVADLAYATNLLFPNFHNKEKDKHKRGRSLPVLAQITLGSTGGTWMKNDKYWTCSVNDLDLQGKALYEQLQLLYEDKATLHLVTWADEG